MLCLEIHAVLNATQSGEDYLVRLKTNSHNVILGRARSIEGVDRIIQHELGDAGFLLEQRWA